MRKFLRCSVMLVCVFVLSFSAYGEIWQVEEQPLPMDAIRKPGRYILYQLDEQTLKGLLAALSDNPNHANVLVLPDPKGGFRSFATWHSLIMEAQLAAKYSMIQTYTGIDIQNRRVIVKLDMTSLGFHAMINDGENSFFIDPVGRNYPGLYMCYYKRDYTSALSIPSETVYCSVPAEQDESLTGQQPLQLGQARSSGTIHRTYRLALACTGEYATAAAGVAATKADVLSAMVTSINRVNGIYERELAITLQLIANNDTLIFLDGSKDPYSNGSGPTMLGENQVTIDNYIGAANYDIGHVFSTGGGGIASLGSVCINSAKARGVTGSPRPVGDPFDVDYVCHEIGHQFGGSHTFNANTGSCNGNGSSNSAYEPGSGSTIMAYAGICGSGNNLQNNSDAYFHTRSLDQISGFINSAGGTCAVNMPSGNTPASVPSIAQSYNIPFKTPFELTAPAVSDSAHDDLTYCWEQWNLGDFGKNWIQTRATGPTFRSFNPDTTATRIFPRLSRLLANTTSYLGEKLADTSRSLSFILTVRDIYNGIGCFNISDDKVDINVINTGSTFAILTPTQSASQWKAGSQADVSWGISGTDQAPISCANVDIFLSVDGGYTYPYLLASQTPNDGLETINVPNIVTDKARVKVKGSGNIFFDISDTNFKIDTTDVLGVNETVAWIGEIKLYPVPATDHLFIEADPGVLSLKIYNTIGILVLDKTSLPGLTDIQVAGWQKGGYFLKFTHSRTGQVITRPVVIY